MARVCGNCRQSSTRGRNGDAGTEHANSWYCEKCWREWEHADRGGGFGGQRTSAAAAYQQDTGRGAAARTASTVTSWGGGGGYASGSSARPKAEKAAPEPRQVCHACRQSASSGRRGASSDNWFCDACLRKLESKPSGPPALSSIDMARQAAEDRRLAREAESRSREEQMARLLAVEGGDLKPVVFWGIADLKYDPRLGPRDRVKVLELGDGRSSRFSHHGRSIEEKFKSEYCMDRDPINRSVMVDNKKFTHDVFVNVGFGHLRPKQFCYPRRYESGLATRIARDCGASGDGAVVLKLVNRSRGAGVVVCPVAELDETLKLLLQPPLHEELETWLRSRTQNAMREDLSSEILTEQRRHYWSNECPLFVAEQLCHSQPVAMPEAGDGALFDGTMRVAFALRRAGGRSEALELDWLGGYWKLPPGEARNGDRGSLEDVHNRLVSSFNTEEKRTAEASGSQLRDVYGALAPALPQVFQHGVLNVQHVTDMYKSDPSFCAWALARVANTTRGADMTKANQLLDLAQRKIEAPKSERYDTLPQRSVLSYVERNLGVNLAMLGAWEKASVHFTRAVRLLPTNATAYYLRGVAYQEGGDFAEAADFHRRAIVLDPDFRSPCMALGTCLAQLGSYGAAVEACRACLHRQPDAPHAQYTMGQAIYQMLRNGWKGSPQETAEMRARGLEALRVAQRGVPKGHQWLSSDEQKLRFFDSDEASARQLPVQKLNLWKQPTGWRPQ